MARMFFQTSLMRLSMIASIIKKGAFNERKHRVSVIMGDNVKIIEYVAFGYCTALRFLRLSKTFEYIEQYAFAFCRSLEALFFPSTVKAINLQAFYKRISLRLLILPHDIDLSNVGIMIIYLTSISRIAETAVVAYATEVSDRLVNEWLIHHMDQAPFHKLCYDSSMTTKQINDYLIENGNESPLQISPIHGMNPLHMLTMTPHAPADTISALVDSNTVAVFCLDNKEQSPLEYARDCYVGGLVGMIVGLCNQRNSSILVESKRNIESTSK